MPKYERYIMSLSLSPMSSINRRYIHCVSIQKKHGSAACISFRMACVPIYWQPMSHKIAPYKCISALCPIGNDEVHKHTHAHTHTHTHTHTMPYIQKPTHVNTRIHWSGSNSGF